METAKYNQWDFCPVSLSAEEAADPFKVIDDFFSSDSLEGNLEMLKDWRDFVLRDDYYRDKKGSPTGLYFFYKQNLKLIDAMYLVMQALSQAKGREHGEHLIQLTNMLAHLPEAETLEIYTTLTSSFSDYNLPQYRQQLDEWLEHGLSANAAGEFITSGGLDFCL